MEISKIIDEALAHFEFRKRSPGNQCRKLWEMITGIKRFEEKIYVLKDGAPEALHESVYKAHGNRLPDDWIYKKYHSILDALSGYTIEKLDDLEENRHEIVDGLVNVYTYDLTAWIAQDVGNVYYITEALEDGEVKDGFQLLMLAQYKAIDEIMGEIISYINKQAESNEK